MKHMLKSVMAFTLVLVMAMGLAGCGNKVGDVDLSDGKNAIYIDEDGRVSYGVTEKFSTDQYDKDELEKYINDEVADYNKSSEASVSDAITVDKYNVKDDNAYLILDIASVYDFNEYIQNYNNESEKTFYAGQIADRGKCKIKGDFVSKNKKENLKGKDIRKMTDSQIVVLNGEYRVQLDADVKYISTNCSIDEDGIITTAKDQVSYIVY